MDKNMKKTIFLSHATPEDNYQAAWLASKLKMVGYDVWIDLEDLSVGDAFNNRIKPVIVDKTCVFIPITTKKYSEKSNDQNTGVSRELNCAATINLEEIGHNFILPVRFDDIEYTKFPYHYMGWNTISFTGNWHNGFIMLIEELEKLSIQKMDIIDNPIRLWHESIRNNNKPIKKPEVYYSNWLNFELPDKISIVLPLIGNKEKIYSIEYPLIMDSNRIITFTDEKTIEKTVGSLNKKCVKVADFLKGDDFAVDENYIVKDTKQKIVYLLNKVFEKHLEKSNLMLWRKGTKSKKNVYYFRDIKDEEHKFISLKRFGMNKSRRSLVGTVTRKIDGVSQRVNWSFSLFAKADLHPKPHYIIYYTVVFMNEKYRRFEKDKQLALRRNIPSEWFNRKWFEMFLAALLKISPSYDDENIEIKIDSQRYLKVNNEPCYSISPIGYIEPND